MKPWWLAVLWVACAWGVEAEGKETLALTVHNDNGDPSEERFIWTKQYFVDAQGRLVREHKVEESAFVGEKEIVTDTRFVWGPDSLSWRWS